MKTSKISTLCIFISMFFVTCRGQKQFGTDQLVLKQSILLPGIKGRIDHMDEDWKDQIIFISALGNNSLEVVNLKTGELIQSIKGLSEPQGVVYIPQTNEIMVANGSNGKCSFFSAVNFEPVGSIDLGSDADNVRYDSIEQKIYVGYGEGGIAVIDAVKHRKIADIKLSAHPEGFQMDRQLRKLFINVPDANQIDVIDLGSQKVAEKWKTDYSANFPMAIDIRKHIVFVGYRHPARLVAMDQDGKTISVADLSGDTDDLYFSDQSEKIYASCGNGAIDIYQFQNPTIKQIARIPSQNGARTSLLVPELHKFILAERASAGDPAQVRVFNIKE